MDFTIRESSRGGDRPGDPENGSLLVRSRSKAQVSGLGTKSTISWNKVWN